MSLSIFNTGAWRIVRRRAIATLLGASLGVMLSHSAGADDGAVVPDLQLALSVDLIGQQSLGNTTANEVALTTPQAMEFSFAGLPVKIGMKDDGPAGSMGLQAGIRGDHELTLGQKLTLNTSVTLAKTGYLDNYWGTDRATASTALSYRHEGLLLVFEPAWSLDMAETAVIQRDYGATARMSRHLFQEFDLSGGVTYGRHDARNAADDYANAAAYGALTYRHAGGLKLEFSYAANYRLSDDLQAGGLRLDDLRYAENSIGPTVTMAFPLGDSLDFAATYRYCRSTDELPSTGAERRIDDIQSLDMSAVWNSDDPDTGGIQFTATYGFDRVDSNDRNADEQTHAATIAMAIPF